MNDMDLTRQILLALVILVATTHVIAAECSADEAQQLREACQQSLQDIRGTRQNGSQAEERGWEASKKGIVEGGSCAARGSRLITSCSSGLLSCFVQIARIQGTIEKCKIAVDYIDTAINHFRQASFYFGTASIAFSDQGGESLVRRLSGCSNPTCHEVLRLTDLSRQDQERVQRNIERLVRYKSQLEEAKSRIEACENKGSSCDPEFPHIIDIEDLEPPMRDLDPPEAPLHLDISTREIHRTP